MFFDSFFSLARSRADKKQRTARYTLDKTQVAEVLKGMGLGMPKDDLDLFFAFMDREARGKVCLGRLAGSGGGMAWWDAGQARTFHFFFSELAGASAAARKEPCRSAP